MPDILNAKPNMDATYANQLNEQRNKDLLSQRMAEIQEAETDPGDESAEIAAKNQPQKTTLTGFGAISLVAVVNDILLGWIGGSFVLSLFGINEAVSTAASAAAATAAAAGTAGTLAALTFWIPFVNIGVGFITAATLIVAGVVAVISKLAVQALGFEIIIAIYGTIKFLNLITSSILYFWMKSKGVSLADLKALANLLIRLIPALGDLLPTSVGLVILVYLKERTALLNKIPINKTAIKS